MIKLARQAYPGLRFDVGSMTALNIADGVLGGVLSRWSATEAVSSALLGRPKRVAPKMAPTDAEEAA